MKIRDQIKIQEMRAETLEEDPWTLRFVSNCFIMPAMLLDNLNTQDTCDKAVYSE